MSTASEVDLLALHGVRVLGAAGARQIAQLYRVDAGQVEEHLLDAEAYGWVTRYAPSGPAGSVTFSLTDRGRAQNERQLTAELDGISARATVTRAHAAFLPLNGRLGNACTRWQLRPTSWDPLAANDHTDRRWDDAVVDELVWVGRHLQAVSDQLTTALTRFGVHAPRYLAAVARVERGERAWIDAPDRPSCHLVWAQLHEDLLATLGIPRGADA